MGRGPGIPEDIDTLLKKHAVTNKTEFLERDTVPNPVEANQAKKDRRATKAITLTRWGGMTKGEDDKDAKQALKLLRWSNYLNGEEYKRPTKDPLPQYYEFGEEVGTKTDLNKPYEQTRRRRNLASSMVKSILKTDAAQNLLKDHQNRKNAFAVKKEKQKERRNRQKRNAKKRKRSAAGL